MIQRLVAYLNHIVRAWPYLDGPTLFQLFVLRKPSVVPLGARIRNGKGNFWYRGFLDRGVMSHFYENGYDLYSESGNPVRCILDFGANIGDETVKFAIRHSQARIIALEPEKENFELLTRNVEPYGTRVVPIRAGVWYRDATLEVIAGRSPESFTVVENAAGSIRARSVSSLIREYKLTKIDILKIDIEGSEYDVFERESEEWLPLVDSIVIEIADCERSGSFQSFFRALERAGFHGDCYICGENIVAIRSGSGLCFRNVMGI